eukprot:TRINITY_DN3893_c0_g3_i2.p1 TRINITY_DN3893_c0_g3~~TRINITY_DN3893_c0_g3_i2.p1  ORF type:complete len:1751 (+),score=530.40 TRINITY_DN3893_c0_g3_i2:134-5386(+)
MSGAPSQGKRTRQDTSESDEEEWEDDADFREEDEEAEEEPEPSPKRRRVTAGTMSGAAHFHAQLQMMKQVSELGLLFPGMGGGGGPPRFSAIISRLDSGDDGEVYSALNELCNILSMASEDSLVGFRTEQVAPPLLRLLQREDHQEIMLLALRTLSHMLDALPNTMPVMVNSGVIPILVGHLLSMQIIDSAELALLSLEKLSVEHPRALLGEGCMAAMLMFFDFFSISLQRKMVASIGNMVKSAGGAQFCFIEDCVPQLTNLLTYDDAKLVEGVALALYRAAVTFQSEEAKLMKLGAGDMVPNLIALLKRDQNWAEGAIWSLVLKTLSVFARRSVPLAQAMMQGSIAAVLFALLRQQGGGGADAGAAGGAKGVSAGTLAEAVDLLERLLPRIQTGILTEIHVDAVEKAAGVARTTRSGDADGGRFATLLAHGDEEEEEEEEVEEPMEDTIHTAGTPATPAGEELSREETPASVNTPADVAAAAGSGSYKHTERVELFTSDAGFMATVASGVTVLIDVHNYTVSKHAEKALSALASIVTYSPEAVLETSLRDVALSSFIANLLATGAPKAAAIGLHLCGVLMTKLPAIFHKWLLREGVGVELAGLAKGDGAAAPPLAAAAVVPPPALSPTKDGTAPPPPAAAVPAYVALIRSTAQGLIDAHFPDGASALQTPKALEDVVTALRGWRGQDSSCHQNAIDSLCRMLYADEDMTTYELVNSRLAAALCDYLSSGAEGNKARIERAHAFVTAMVQRGPAEEGATPEQASQAPSYFVRLVKKVVATLNQCERLPVYVSEHGADGAGWGTSLKLLAQPFRLALEGDDASLGGPASMTVLIEPLATVGAVEEFVTTKIAALRAGMAHAKRRGPRGDEESHMFPEHAEHPLIDAMHVVGGWTCDKCGESLRGPGVERWRCFICDFDLCGPCAAPTLQKAREAKREERKAERRTSAGRRERKDKEERKDAKEERRQREEAGDSSASRRERDRGGSAGNLLWHLRRDKTKGKECEQQAASSSSQQPATPEPRDRDRRGEKEKEKEKERGAIGSPLDSINRLRGMVRNCGRRNTNPAAPSTSSPAPAPSASSPATPPNPTRAAAPPAQSSRTPSVDAELPPLRGVTFSLNGKMLPSSMTMFQAVHAYGGWCGHTEGGAASGRGVGEKEVVHASRAMWGQVYKLCYKASAEEGNAATPEAVDGAAERAAPPAPKVNFLTESDVLLPAPQYLEMCDKPLELVEAYPELVDDASRALLRLLVLLHSLAESARSIQEGGGCANFGVGRHLTQHEASGIPSDDMFCSQKITNKITRQILDGLLLCAGHPGNSWCRPLLNDAPFLVSFPTKLKFFELTCFNPSRAIIRLQEILVERGEETKQKLGRIQKQKIRLERDAIIDSAKRIMDRYGGQKAYLEFEFFGEVGTGLGPTMEFYTLVSNALREDAVQLFLPGVEGVTTVGLFPRPLPTDHPKRDEVLVTAKLFGQFIARAMYDRRVIDLPPSLPLLKLLRGDAMHLDDLQAICKTKYQTVKNFLHLAKQRDCMLSRGASREEIENTLLFKDAKVADLCLNFTDPFYGELCDGGEEKDVTVWNMDEYAMLATEMMLDKGNRDVVNAIVEGVDQVFPMRQLSFFSLPELDLMLCGSTVDLTIPGLEAATICDHGYTHASRAVTMLFDILASFSEHEVRAFFAFVTGAPRLPVGGLKALKPNLTIVRKTADAGVNPDHVLPSVMTCQNYLKLPDYSSREVMREKLFTAMTEGANAFHLS